MPVLEFFADTTQLLARRCQRSRSSRVYHTSRIPPLTPVSSGVSKASGQILLSRISIVRPSFCLVYDPSLHRSFHDLDILSHIFSPRERQRIDATRDALFHENSVRLLTRSKKKNKIFDLVSASCVLRVYNHARSRRSEWPATRTRSRRVADREVDHVIEHRIVPLGAPQETNDEVYRQGPD